MTRLIGQPVDSFSAGHKLYSSWPCHKHSEHCQTCLSIDGLLESKPSGCSLRDRPLVSDCYKMSFYAMQLADLLSSVDEELGA